MKRQIRRAVAGALVMLAIAPPVHAQATTPPPPAVASLGRCRLAAGAVIPNCRVAYREFGPLNPERTNTVLIPTWLLGRSDDWVSLVGPDGFVDTTRFHVVIVDALGDGHSSSPSNTPSSGRAAFAQLTVGDMVESQYRLLTERLGIRHLRAVVGFSMGGMQAIDWAVRHPDFVDRVVPIAGSPRVGAFDRLMWTAMLNEIEDGRRAGTPADSVWARLAHLEMLFVQTPIGVNSKGADTAGREIAINARQYGRDWKLEDYAAQLRAIRRYDVTPAYGGDIRRAAARVTAPMLAVYSWDDHMVTAGPVAEFARLVRADTLSVASPCGHVMMFCEQARVAAAVRAFIAR
jgi:homoserine O-acetyltransferase